MICRLNTVSFKIPGVSFVWVEKRIIKVIQKRKRWEGGKGWEEKGEEEKEEKNQIFEKNKCGEFAPPNLNPCYKTTIMKTRWY